MWEQLPKLLDRDFFIAYFLPAAFFVTAVAAVLLPVPPIGKFIVELVPEFGSEIISGAILSAILGMQLMLLNRFFTRFLEGYYWPFSKITWLKEKQIHKFDTAVNYINNLRICLRRMRDSLEFNQSRKSVLEQLLADIVKQAKELKIESVGVQNVNQTCQTQTRANSETSVDDATFSKEAPLSKTVRQELVRLEESWGKSEREKSELEKIIVTIGSKIARHERTYNQESERFAVMFPDSTEYVLPTSFGNIMRAFEVYSRVMYGIDSIPAWYRMAGVVSSDFAKAQTSAKAVLDNCINVIFLTLAVCPFIIGRFWIEVQRMQPFQWREFIIANWWEPVALILAVGIAVVAYCAAKYAAAGWGNYVKAAFDIYADGLARALGYKPPLPKDVWQEISRAFIYRDPLPTVPQDGDQVPSVNVPGPAQKIGTQRS